MRRYLLHLYALDNQGVEPMLRKLLELIAQGDVHSQVELARKLGASDGLLVQMLEDLERMGYLSPLDGSCAGQCAACPLAKVCIIGHPRGAWVPTDKGRKASGKKRKGPGSDPALLQTPDPTGWIRRGLRV